MDSLTQLWISYFGLCALFLSKGSVPWPVIALLGVPFSWWTLTGRLTPSVPDPAKDAEGFATGGVRIVRESGKPCLLRERGVTYKGCYYADVGGCVIPDAGMKGGHCPSNYGEFRRRYGGPEAGAPSAGNGEGPDEECSGDTWVKIVSLRDDEMERLLTSDATHPLAACVRRRAAMVGRMRERFLDDLKNADNTQELCHRVRRDEFKASNRVARQMFREVYRECFRDAEPAEPGAATVVSSGNGNETRVQTSGFVLMDEPEMLTIDKNGRESDDVLRRHMRQEFVSKCQRFVSQKTPEQVQAFIELGEKVENLEWWKNVSMMVERTADEIRKAQLLSTTRTGPAQMGIVS